jgi:hypothetical protein
VPLISIRLFIQPDFGSHPPDFRFLLGSQYGVRQLDGNFLQDTGELVLAYRRPGVFAADPLAICHHIGEVQGTTGQRRAMLVVGVRSSNLFGARHQPFET